jgi:hypothetical protein
MLEPGKLLHHKVLHLAVVAPNTVKGEIAIPLPKGTIATQPCVHTRKVEVAPTGRESIEISPTQRIKFALSSAVV